MSPALPIWTAADALAAALAAVLLLRASTRLGPAAGNGHRWLAAAACCWGAGGIAQSVFGGLIGGAAPLRAADLISLAALPALVLGVAALTAGTDWDRPGSGAAGQAYAIVADGGLLIAALFVIGWVTMFGPAYTAADVGAPAFALDLIRPAADLVAVGTLLPLAVRRPRVALLPVLALAVMTVGDCLAVAARADGAAAAAAPRLLWLAGLGLLAVIPLTDPAGSWLGAHPGMRLRRPGSWAGGPATIIALTAATAAAIVLTGYALGGGSVASPALAISGAVVVLVLVIRLAGLARQQALLAAAARESDRMFRALAGTTSDAVAVCDLAGTIEYVSPAIAEYGYAAGQLIGTRLADLVHPQDRLAAIRAALRVLSAQARGDGDGQSGAPGGDGQPGEVAAAAATAEFAGRVRGADGSWRHVECVLSWYRPSGSTGKLLVSARDVSDRIALRRELTHLTFHDGLTGLPNRAFVEERVKELPGQADVVDGAILVDLDRYTVVNDMIGHGGGDLVLAQAGRRLRAAAPKQATVARWGGDEFAILLAGAVTAHDVLDLAERLAAQIAAEPFSAAGKDIPLTASVGVALTPASPAGQLLNDADVAMSRAKEAGGGRLEVFTAQMHADSQHRLELAASLQQAISEHRLDIEYQPVVELDGGRVVAVEALIRWCRDGQAVPPADFLGVADETGLIVPIGEWVLREACRELAALHADGSDVGLCVNVSGRQVSAPGFAASVLGAVRAAGLPPGSVTLEVTERVLIDSAGPAVTELAALRAQGIRLAIDDFGTGYASLRYLPQLAVDIIKIDPSFVAGLGIDPTMTLLTKTVVQVGHDLGIEVVAEGIERPEQVRLLREMGCDLGQGFAVARPAAADGVAAMLAAQVVTGVRAGQQAGAAACSPAS